MKRLHTRRPRRGEWWQLAMLAVLAALVLSAFGFSRRLDRSRERFSVDAYQALLVSMDASVEAIGQRMAAEGMASDIEGLADPDAPADGADPRRPGAAGDAPADAAQGAFTLTGISWVQGAPMAFMNGQVVEVGDRVQGFRVTRIEPEAVTLTDDDGRVRTVRLYPE